MMTIVLLGGLSKFSTVRPLPPFPECYRRG